MRICFLLFCRPSSCIIRMKIAEILSDHAIQINKSVESRQCERQFSAVTPCSMTFVRAAPHTRGFSFAPDASQVRNTSSALMVGSATIFLTFSSLKNPFLFP